MAEPTEAEIKALAKEQELIKQGVANLTLAWASVENALVTVLFVALGGNNGVVSAMYFSLSNLESRIGIVGAALAAMFRTSVAEQELGSEWGYIANKFNNLKKTRNKVAHGQITSGYFPNFGHRVRLTSPLFHFGPIVEAYQRGQLPGLGSNELNDSTAAVYRLVSVIDAIKTAVDAMRQGDGETSRRILVELIAKRQRPDAGGIQSPQEPDGLPLSPEAEE